MDLAQAILDAYDLVMEDNEIPKEVKDRIATSFIGVPELAETILKTPKSNSK